MIHLVKSRSWLWFISNRELKVIPCSQYGAHKSNANYEIHLYRLNYYVCFCNIGNRLGNPCLCIPILINQILTEKIISSTLINRSFQN